MIKTTVNGEARSFDGDPETPLLWYLRDELGLTGTRFGCGQALCGACTIHLGGTAVRSCITPVSNADGQQVTTIEGLSADGNHPVQVAWRDLNVAQCGYCQVGSDHEGGLELLAAIRRSRPTTTPDSSMHMDGNHLSLRHLSAHSRGDQAGRRSHARIRPRRAELMTHDHFPAEQPTSDKPVAGTFAARSSSATSASAA